MDPPTLSPTSVLLPEEPIKQIAQDSRDMSAVATLHMQDLDVGDGDNRTNSLMMSRTQIESLRPKTPSTNAPPTSTPRARETPTHRHLRQKQSSEPSRDIDERSGRPGQTQTAQEHCEDESNVKYCYRHRPDLKSIRRADDFSLQSVQQNSGKELGEMSYMEQQSIQNVWSLFSGASGKQRELMLRGMLAQCCFPQLSYVSARVRELLKIDFLTALPPELGLRTLGFLDARSLTQAAQVSRTWRNLADDDVIWHRMCEQHIDRKCNTCGWGLPLLDRERLRNERKAMEDRLVQQTLPLPTTATSSHMSHDEIHRYPDSASDDGESGPSQKPGGKKRTAAAIIPQHQVTIKKSCTPAHNYQGAEKYFQTSNQRRLRPWKDVYRDRFIIGINWKHGRCTEKVLRGHTNEVTCLQFDEQIIATGSYDATIRIWDVNTGEELRTLRGHTMGVKCLQFDKSKLVSGSLDGTLKMWDLKNGKVIRTFPGHSGAVVSVHFDGSILASGSQDRTIRVRDFADCSRVSLRGHTDYVNAVRVDAASKTLFSASDDCTVRVWDLQGKRCLKVLRGHSLQVTQVLPLPCGFDMGEADFMEEDTPPSSSGSSSDNFTVSVPVAVPSNSLGGRSPPRFILTSSMDSTVRLWEVSTGRCVRTFFGHMEGIWSIAADTLRMISGSNDGFVKVWDTRTGKQERSLHHHSGPVTCVGLSDRRMVTGSEDHEIRTYNFGG